MDSPPSKRRRTSPRFSDQSAPDHRNSASNAESTTPQDPPPDATPSRSKLPSFASPTKASLARHNPDILERRRSVTRGENNGRSGLAPAAAAASTGVEVAETVADAPLVQSVETANPDQTVDRQSPRPLARSPMRSPTRSAMRSPMRSPARKLGSTLTEPPRRTPVKPVPRPLPPPDPQRSEDILGPLIMREKQKAGLDMFRTEEEPPEPELPPTPEHRDPELSNPPAGIHNGTPTKRPKKGKGRGKKRKGSPSKRVPLKAPLTMRGKGSEQESRESRPKNSYAARGIKPADPDADKKAERDALLSEIAQLEVDLSLATSVNAAIREAALSRTDPPRHHRRNEVFGLLKSRALPAEKETTDATTEWLQAAANPIAFLPFGKPTADLEELLSFGQATKDAEEPPVSHHPLPMTAAEELPYLQAFTPLAFDSSIVVLPQETPDAPLMQKHLITATSTSPPGLFIARIEMTVNATSLRVTELSVPRVEPAAAPELLPFVDRIAGSSQRESGSALVRNVTVLAWAMGEWVRVAVRRAKFWCVLAKLLENKDGLAASLESLRLRKKRGHRRRRKGAAAAEDEEGDDEDDENDELNSGDQHAESSTSISEVSVREHLGRTAMDVPIPGLDHDGPGSPSALRVQWKIEFDWTGEAQSQVGILVGVPGKWRKTDDRGRLADLPKLFDQLVQGDEEPETAVQTIVALLAGEGV